MCLKLRIAKHSYRLYAANKASTSILCWVILLLVCANVPIYIYRRNDVILAWLLLITVPSERGPTFGSLRFWFNWRSLFTDLLAQVQLRSCKRVSKIVSQLRTYKQVNQNISVCNLLRYLHLTKQFSKILFCRPHIRQEYPLNLSILLSGGKESKCDFPSNGEWTGISLALRLSGMVGSNVDRRTARPLSGAALQTTMFSDIIGSRWATICYS